MWTLSEKKRGGGIYLTVTLQGENSEKPVFTSSTQLEGDDREKRGGSRFSHITKPKGAYRYDVTNIVFVSSINQHTLNPDSSEKGCEKELDILINSRL